LGSAPHKAPCKSAPSVGRAGRRRPPVSENCHPRTVTALKRSCARVPTEGRVAFGDAFLDERDERDVGQGGGEAGDREQGGGGKKARNANANTSISSLSPGERARIARTPPVLNRMMLGLHQHMQAQHRLQRRRVREPDPLGTRGWHPEDDRHDAIFDQAARANGSREYERSEPPIDRVVALVPVGARPGAAPEQCVRGLPRGGTSRARRSASSPSGVSSRRSPRIKSWPPGSAPTAVGCWGVSASTSPLSWQRARGAAPDDLGDFHGGRSVRGDPRPPLGVEDGRQPSQALGGVKAARGVEGHGDAGSGVAFHSPNVSRYCSGTRLTYSRSCLMKSSTKLDA
jgi:hypothetical protein